MTTGSQRGRARTVALSVVVLAGAALAGEPDGNGVAPRNEWCCEGGSPARTRATATPAVDGPVEIAWEHVPKDAEVCGEPIVFQRWACVDEERARGHALVFVDVFDGHVLDEVLLRDAAGPLLVSQAGGTVAVRSAPEEWRTYVVRDGKAVQDGKFGGAGRILDMLTVWDDDFGTRVLIRQADGLTLRDTTTGEAVWTTRNDIGRTRGRIAVRDGIAYVLGGVDRTELLAFDMRLGARAGSVALGYDPDRGKSDFGDATLHVFPTSVVISGVKTERPTFPAERLVYVVKAVTTGKGQALIDDVGLLEGSGSFCAAGDTWLAVLDDPKHKGLRLSRSHGDGRFSILSRSPRDGLLGGALHPTLAAGTTLLGRFAAAGDELAVRWTAPLPDGARVVPARGRVLYAYPDRVVAVRPSRTDGPRVQLLRVPRGEFLGSIVKPDGEILDGSIVVDGDARTVALKDRQPVPVDETSLVMNRRGGIVALALGDEVEDALISLSRKRRGEALADLAVEAAGARDVDLISRLSAYATSLEGPPEVVKRAAAKRKGVARLKDPRVDEKVAAEVRAKAEPLLRDDAATLGDVYRGLPDETTPEVRIDLLRLIARSGAGAGEFRADVLALLPESMRPKGDFDVLAWLEVADAVRTTELEIVPAPTADTPELTPGERLLGALTYSWRKDLIGVRSKQLMVVAPLENPAAIGRCLTVGELVCDRLEEVFASGQRDRSSRFPIMILVYPTEEEYRERAREKGGRDHVSEYSAGHYSPGDELSHMYLPADPDAFRAMLPTFAHELTHQWLAERCPLFSTAERKGSGRPGYWLVEGFAEMVEERVFDVRARTWHFDPRAKSLAAVAALADQKRLIPWSRYFAMDYDAFSKLDHEYEIPVPGGRELAGGGLFSETNVFYAQGAATCQYLFEANDGALREKLLEYLRLQYIGTPPDIEAHFGMAPDALGARIVAWAREQIAR